MMNEAAFRQETRQSVGIWARKVTDMANPDNNPDKVSGFRWIPAPETVIAPEIPPKWRDFGTIPSQTYEFRHTVLPGLRCEQFVMMAHPNGARRQSGHVSGHDVRIATGKTLVRLGHSIRGGATIVATDATTGCREKPAVRATDSGSRQISQQTVASWAFSPLSDRNPDRVSGFTWPASLVGLLRKANVRMIST